jgi:hypothetical protein
MDELELNLKATARFEAALSIGQASDESGLAPSCQLPFLPPLQVQNRKQLQHDEQQTPNTGLLGNKACGQRTL